MRAIFVVLGLLLLISLAVWKIDAQDSPTTTGATEQPTVISIVTDSATEIPLDGNLGTSEIVATIEPTDLPPSATYPLPPTEIPPSTETMPPYPIVTASPTDLEPGAIPSLTEPFVVTQTMEFTEAPTNSFTMTPTDIAIVEMTSTNQRHVTLVACDLDVDTDGVVTDRDLSKIGKDLLNSPVNETTSKFDLNANLHIDIGDLQKMTMYLSTKCSK